MSDENDIVEYAVQTAHAARDNGWPKRQSELAAPTGSDAGVKYPKGVCIVCGSVLLLQYWRGHPGNQRIHCNDCGSEVTLLMHEKRQPNAGTQRPGTEPATRTPKPGSLD